MEEANEEVYDLIAIICGNPSTGLPNEILFLCIQATGKCPNALKRFNRQPTVTKDSIYKYICEMILFPFIQWEKKVIETNLDEYYKHVCLLLTRMNEIDEKLSMYPGPGTTLLRVDCNSANLIEYCEDWIRDRESALANSSSGFF